MYSGVSMVYPGRGTTGHAGKTVSIPYLAGWYGRVSRLLSSSHGPQCAVCAACLRLFLPQGAVCAACRYRTWGRGEACMRLGYINHGRREACMRLVVPLTMGERA